MKTSKFLIGFFVALTVALMLSHDIYAQNNRGRNDRARGYSSYYGSRPGVSVGIGYNPYYNFHPVFRPRVYYRPAYRLPYRYVRYGPAPGIRISILPVGYSRFYIGNNTFYYNQGIYYRPYKSGGYVVTQPPLGANVKSLPAGAKVTVIDGQKYYELGGTFYQERVTANNKVRYEVVGTDGVLNTTNTDADADEMNDTDDTPARESNKNPAPVNGSVVNQLPASCTAVTIDEQKYFISPSGVYYQEVINGNNIVSYKISGTAATGLQSAEAPAGAE